MQKKLSTAGDNRKYHKVTDHFHYTENYREAAHNIFNLRYKSTKKKFTYYFIMVLHAIIIL